MAVCTKLVTMAQVGSSVFSRRVLVLASAVLGLFVLFDLALFGWLIFRSLSQREVEEILLETRQQAEGLAEQIAGFAADQGQDLYTAIAAETETLTYIDSLLKQREFVRTVEIRNAEGLLVFRARSDSTIPTEPGDLLQVGTGELPPTVETEAYERRYTREVNVPIADLGYIQIGISQSELERRIQLLRRDLIGQTTGIGTVTLAVLLLAYLGIWWLWRRGRVLEEQAMEAERMAYVGTLASGLAHEIRNPLNSLSLNMQLLEEDLGGSGQSSHGRLLAITREEIGRLERLVTDFLAYARPRRLELEDVPAADLVARSREVLAGQIQAREARVTVEDRSGGARIRVDPAQMNQLLINLLQNALAATEECGRTPLVRLLVARDNGRVVLEVSDNGRGIPAANRERIFDLFFSTRKGGTGLGLAIVERISRAHGGQLEVESAAGVGTTIRLVLPEAARPSAAAVLDPSLEPG